MAVGTPHLAPDRVYGNAEPQHGAEAVAPGARGQDESLGVKFGPAGRHDVGAVRPRRIDLRHVVTRENARPFAFGGGGEGLS